MDLFQTLTEDDLILSKQQIANKEYGCYDIIAKCFPHDYLESVKPRELVASLSKLLKADKKFFNRWSISKWLSRFKKKRALEKNKATLPIPALCQVDTSHLNPYNFIPSEPMKLTSIEKPLLQFIGPNSSE